MSLCNIIWLWLQIYVFYQKCDTNSSKSFSSFCSQNNVKKTPDPVVTIFFGTCPILIKCWMQSSAVCNRAMSWILFFGFKTITPILCVIYRERRSPPLIDYKILIIPFFEAYAAHPLCSLQYAILTLFSS